VLLAHRVTGHAEISRFGLRFWAKRHMTRFASFTAAC
jgi:hypothetical protein